MSTIRFLKPLFFFLLMLAISGGGYLYQKGYRAGVQDGVELAKRLIQDPRWDLYLWPSIAAIIIAGFLGVIVYKMLKPSPIEAKKRRIKESLNEAEILTELDGERNDLLIRAALGATMTIDQIKETDLPDDVKEQLIMLVLKKAEYRRDGIAKATP